MAPFDYSLSNASTGVDKRAPAGRCTFEASCPNRSGLDEILALKGFGEKTYEKLAAKIKEEQVDA